MSKRSDKIGICFDLDKIDALIHDNQNVSVNLQACGAVYKFNKSITHVISFYCSKNDGNELRFSLIYDNPLKGSQTRKLVPIGAMVTRTDGSHRVIINELYEKSLNNILPPLHAACKYVRNQSKKIGTPIPKIRKGDIRACVEFVKTPEVIAMQTALLNFIYVQPDLLKLSSLEYRL